MSKFKIKSSIVLNKLNSLLMRKGKKNKVKKMVLLGIQSFYEAAENPEITVSLKNVCVLTSSLLRIKPALETRKVRRGAKFYDVPFFIKRPRAFSLALRWFAAAVRKHSSIASGVKKEFKLLIKKSGDCIKTSKALREKVSNGVIYSNYRW